MSGTRDENIFMAQLAEQSQRFDDMIEYTKRLAKMGSELSVDERNLLSVAYKHSVGARRQSWRHVHMMEQRELNQPGVVEFVRGYREKIETELNQTCTDVLSILTNDLLPRATEGDAQVFYMKMKGDYNRYLFEFSAGDAQTHYADQAQECYQQASVTAMSTLPPTDPIRLGLALNFSVFHYEVCANASQACTLARTAFDDAAKQMDQLNEAQYQDSVQILQLLRDNLTLWQNDLAQPTEDGRPPEQDGTGVEDL